MAFLLGLIILTRQEMARMEDKNHFLVVAALPSTSNSWFEVLSFALPVSVSHGILAYHYSTWSSNRGLYIGNMPRSLKLGTAVIVTQWRHCYPERQLDHHYQSPPSSASAPVCPASSTSLSTRHFPTSSITNRVLPCP